MTVLKISAAGLATLALLAGAQAHAQGVITFQSAAPAVGAAVQATQAGRAQAAKPPAQMPGINRVEMPPVSRAGPGSPLALPWLSSVNSES